jgi:hypothetical protein
LDSINKIEKKAGFTPQIIVTDHIRNLGSEAIDEKYFKEDWRNGKALI